MRKSAKEINRSDQLRPLVHTGALLEAEGICAMLLCETGVRLNVAASATLPAGWLGARLDHGRIYQRACPDHQASGIQLPGHLGERLLSEA